MNHIDDYLLNEYLDGQLDAATRMRVGEHLAVCEDCQVRLAEEQALFASLAQMPDVPLTVDLSRQVVARLSAEFKPRPIPRWAIPVVALQVLTAVVLFVWLWPSIQPVLETAGQALPQNIEQILPDLSLSQAVDPLASGAEWLSDLGRALTPDSSLPILEGFLIIGLAFILWLAGSGLLLRQSLATPNKS
ncbi:MAG: zf-HC2 domain-containing protein [Candidatus Promineifilaceae bacterium]